MPDLFSQNSEITPEEHAIISLGEKVKAYLLEPGSSMMSRVKDFSQINLDLLKIKKAVEKTTYFNTPNGQENIVRLFGIIEEMVNTKGAVRDYWLEKTFDFYDLIENNPQSPENFERCLKTLPPKNYRIIRFIKKGGQKEVFEAEYDYSINNSILKKFISDYEDRVDNELVSQSFNHPNINNSFYRQNDIDEKFIIEEKILVLRDFESFGSIIEPLNLMYDLASAVRELHRRGFAHLDIKPENIGKRGSNYVLMDFGVCQKFSQIVKKQTETGTLRTRSPELFLSNIKVPDKADIWAIGATVFHVQKGRYPMFKDGEVYPESRESKDDLAQKIKKRIEDSYDDHVEFSDIEYPLNELLGKCLKRKPEERASIDELLDSLDELAGSYLRKAGDGIVLHPKEELRQLMRVIPYDINLVKNLPYHEKNEIIEKINGIVNSLREANQLEGLVESEKNLIDLFGLNEN